jgi:fatty-acyl-CoA synthase
MIGHQLARQAARRPHTVALTFGRRQTTNARQYARACRLAQALAALGGGRGDRVATLLHNGEACFEALFGTALLGAVVVPFNFRLVAREIGLQLESSTPRVLLAGREFGDVLDVLRTQPAFPEHVRWIDDPDAPAGAGATDGYEAWLMQHPAVEPTCAVPAEAPQMLMHSSGTTGHPKGVIFTHATTLASSMAKIIDFRLTADDVTVVFGPLFHAGPLMDLALPLLLHGGRVVIGASRQFDPRVLLKTVALERGTVIPIYPTMLRRLVAEPEDATLDLSSLRLIITGGESCPVPVIEGVHRRFPDVEFLNNYGSTEGGPVTTFLDPALSRIKMGSVGREAFGMEVRIVDAQGCRLGPGEVGEIEVRGPFTTPGYWNRPEATAAQRRDGWWRTGDLAWRDEDGCLWISGRSKDMIKSGTENIFPIEVEQAIASLPGVTEVGVIGVPDETWGETVVAFVVADRPGTLDAEDVVAHCRTQLASYKKPRHVVFVDGLPRGTTGKVDKQRLRAQWDVGAR